MRSVRTCLLLVFAFVLPLIGCDDRQPVAPPPCPWFQPDAIQRFSFTYQRRGVSAFAELLPPSDVPLVGLLGLDATETLCLHQRLFAPELIPGPPVVPDPLWLISIAVSLNQISSYVERPDLYRSESNPDGLEPGRWKAVAADFAADALFDTQSVDADARVTTRFSFVVIEDLRDGDCGPHQYLYRWEEVGGTPWSDFIGQYQGPCGPGNASR